MAANATPATTEPPVRLLPMREIQERKIFLNLGVAPLSPVEIDAILDIYQKRNTEEHRPWVGSRGSRGVTKVRLVTKVRPIFFQENCRPPPL